MSRLQHMASAAGLSRRCHDNFRVPSLAGLRDWKSMPVSGIL